MDITQGNIIRYAGTYYAVLSVDYEDEICLCINKFGVVSTFDLSSISKVYKTEVLESVLSALDDFETDRHNDVSNNTISLIGCLNEYMFKYEDEYYEVTDQFKRDGSYFYAQVKKLENKHLDWVELQVLLNRITHGD